ncbi:MAG: MBL fold metallo-hydrolase [Bacteroidota bacterium]|nr:MBL fold metallo-hydrolase [Bacteroidota bacterium]
MRKGFSMNKLVKKIAYIIVGCLLIVIVLGLIYFFKFRSETQKMSPCPTQELASGLYSINDSFVNMYLVKDGDSYIAIDAGNDAVAIAKGLKQLQIDPSRVTTVLLTHSDVDHTAALKLFRNAELRFSKEEEQMINGKTARAAGMHNSIDRKQYKLINDGETFMIGTTSVRGILTPGHTPGSMCYLVNNRWLFTGDALGLKNGKIVPFNDFFNMNTAQAVKSISNVTLLRRVELLLTGHYGCSDKFDKIAAEWDKSHK